MAGEVSITLTSEYLVRQIYAKLAGELKSFGGATAPVVEGLTIRVQYVKGVEEILWRVVKSTPAAVFASIDFKK